MEKIRGSQRTEVIGYECRMAMQSLTTGFKLLPFSSLTGTHICSDKTGCAKTGALVAGRKDSVVFGVDLGVLTVGMAPSLCELPLVFLLLLC